MMVCRCFEVQAFGLVQASSLQWLRRRYAYAQH